MPAILFYEFAQKMGSVIKGKITNGDFTFRLFAAVLPEKKKDLLGNIPDSTLRGYYNGNSEITQVAKRIYADASAASFENFINDLGKGAKTKLSEVFSDDLTDITPDNAGKLLSKLFLEIIKDAAEENDESREENMESDEYSETIETDKTIIHSHVTQNGINNKVLTFTAPVTLNISNGWGGL